MVEKMKALLHRTSSVDKTLTILNRVHVVNLFDLGNTDDDDVISIIYYMLLVAR